MSNKIIQTLKKFPHRDIAEIAKMLDLSTKAVSEAQRDYYSLFIKRDSPLWGKPGQQVNLYRLNLKQ